MHGVRRLRRERPRRLRRVHIYARTFARSKIGGSAVQRLCLDLESSMTSATVPEAELVAHVLSTEYRRHLGKDGYYLFNKLPLQDSIKHHLGQKDSARITSFKHH
ncbi:hypothetical protein PV11_08179 [Exophiala sideris]|uniref:Uncharacterized protein n=1 Tax=Exophiala sideris TaxID=1016849 RepID=A0A0D1VWN1_9EURO|nr:hypothetical protein PV11_08179 [Exophiala sideris]